MIIRAAKRFHINLDLGPRDLADLVRELEPASPNSRLGQLCATLKAVAETKDLDISFDSEVDLALKREQGESKQ